MLILTVFILWTALVSFFYGANVSFPGNSENVVLDEIFWGIGLTLLFLLAGNRLLKIFSLDHTASLEEALFSVGTGMGLFSVLIFILGVFRLFYPETMILLLLGFLLLAAVNYDYGKRLLSKVKNWHPTFSFSELLLLFLLVGFIALTLMNTLTPPISRDALIHHLAIPKWYIKQHGIVDIPFSIPSYYPPLMEMLYTGALLLSSDLLAQLLHFIFFLGSLLFTYVLGKQFLSRPMSLLATLLFGSLPVVCQVSSIAYADLGLTFFTLGGFFALLQWSTTRAQGWFSLGALMTGFAVACKYNGCIVLFSFMLGIILIFHRWQVPLKLLIKHLLLFSIVVIMVNFFWLARNAVFTGNPLYPLAGNYLGKPYLPYQTQLSQYQIRHLLWGETLGDQILLPWNLSLKTISKARYELDGVINPIFLVFLPFFILSSPKNRSIKFIGFFCLLYFLVFWASSRVRLRYLMPIYPMLGIITAYTFAQWEGKRKKILIAVPLGLSFILNLYWLLVYTSSINPIDFLVGKETRQAFLNQHIPSYPVFEYINTFLPQGVRIMFLYGGNYGNDGYYLDCGYFFDSRDMGYTGKEILNKATTSEEVRKEFARRGITHVLINWKRLQLDFTSSLSAGKIRLFRKFCREFLYLEFEHGGSFLYRLL